MTISVGEEGPVRASLKVERTWGDSKFTQYLTLTDGASDDRLDIHTTIDWNSRNTLLKAEFPMSVSNAKAAYDLVSALSSAATTRPRHTKCLP